ncbi:anhydro-N-acetylmuramic acid kinase [uncultured Algimonas sp.]|uniref:anhydro-N-acetylmuramic acid kinase n=1 Tax=uncultured Algimonas sp. TaxID=1547920 RepID=UPI00262BC836|nr:anhydro-N-acetylmuramic acid kinase [uncultured Algimonas sp.]
MTKIYKALGLMSGTSLDGVDAAIIETDGVTIQTFGPARTTAFTASQQDTLSEATQAAVRWNFDGPRPNSLFRAEDIADAEHAAAVKSLLAAHGLTPHDIDVVGYHGQTVLHDGAGGRTLQIGDGQRLADRLGITTVWDFRSADVAAGGQGAPIAPIFHKALVARSGLDGVTAVLNLGGVGNVSIIDDEALSASDTGPANGPLDSFLRERGIAQDEAGSVSMSGDIDFALVERWTDRAFFRQTPPRSADRHDFDVWHDLAAHGTADGAATLCAFAARGVAQTLRAMAAVPARIVLCGGGRHNRTLATLIAMETGCQVVPAERLGWNSDSIESQAFAYLAVRVLEGLPNSFPETTGVREPTVGGVVSWPGA